jgi:hypothetical protein
MNLGSLMFKHYFASLLVLANLLFAPCAEAFIDPPYITPETPASGQPVAVNVRTGLCDAILSLQGVTRSENEIRALFFGVRYFDSELCNLPTFTTTESLGTYASGSYTLQVDLAYAGVGGSTVIETIGTVPFVVGGGTPAAVAAPVNAPASLFILFVAILVVVARRLRFRAGMLGLLVAYLLSPYLQVL